MTINEVKEKMRSSTIIGDEIYYRYCPNCSTDIKVDRYDNHLIICSNSIGENKMSACNFGWKETYVSTRGASQEMHFNCCLQAGHPDSHESGGQYDFGNGLQKFYYPAKKVKPVAAVSNNQKIETTSQDNKDKFADQILVMDKDGNRNYQDPPEKEEPWREYRIRAKLNHPRNENGTYRYEDLPINKQNNPDYYDKDTYEVYKVINAWNCNFHIGNIIKYAYRNDKKHKTLEGQIMDLKKIIDYANFEIERINTNGKK